MAVLLPGMLMGALGLGACSAARTGLGTSDESCYLALPTAAKAVGGHGHLAGVRMYSLAGLRSVAPHMSGDVGVRVPKGQSVCLAGYTGHFTAGTVDKPLGRPAGSFAVAVVTTPGNQLLGTVILMKVPLRFQHSHSF
jgi:hypothetical protein